MEIVLRLGGCIARQLADATFESAFKRAVNQTAEVTWGQTLRKAMSGDARQQCKSTERQSTWRMHLIGGDFPEPEAAD